MGQLASDNFTRANENPLSDGGNWTTLPGSNALEISSDLCQSATAGGMGIGSAAYWNAITPPTDQYSSITVATISNLNGNGTDAAAVVRVQSGSSSIYYEGGVGAQQSGTTGLGNSCYLWIGKVDVSSETELAQAVAVANIGDVFNLTVHGPTLLLRQNGAVVLIGADSSLVNGWFGLHSKCDASITTSQMSAWSAGTPVLNLAPFADTFVRANGALGANWLNINVEGTLSISSDAVYNPGGGYGVEASIGADYLPDQYAQTTLVANQAGSYAGVAVRISGNGTAAQYSIPTANASYYTWVIGNSSSYVLQKITSATSGSQTSTNLWTGSGTVSNGDTVRLEIQGNTLTCYRNGVVVTTYTDASSPLVGGHPGIVVYNGGTSPTVNAFLSGSFRSIPILSSATVQSGATLSTAGTGVINANQFGGISSMGSVPTHEGQLLISQPGNLTAAWADPQVQGLYAVGSFLNSPPSYVAPTTIQPVLIGGSDYAGSPALWNLKVDSGGKIYVGNFPSFTFTYGGSPPTEGLNVYVLNTTSTEVPAASGGATPKGYHIANNTVQAIKSTFGQIYGYYLDNTANAATTYFQFFNIVAGSVSLGSSAALFTIPVPAGSAANLSISPGWAFSTAISFAATTTYNGSTFAASPVDCTIAFN
jgi:hypothetical protein